MNPASIVFSRGFVRKICATATVLLVIPFPALAADGWNAILSTADSTTVTQGDFLRAAMKGMRVSLMTDEKKLPYRGISSSLMPYVQTAHALGALKVFNNRFAPARSITRGQAMAILVELDTLQSVKGARPAYKDVKPTTIEGRAALIAIQKDWLPPVSTTVYGVQQVLNGKDARTLLQNSTGLDPAEIPADGTVRIKVPILRVKTSPSTQSLPNEEITNTIWQLINKEYLYSDKIKPDESGWKAAEGMVNTLNDPYTQFMRPASTKSFQSQLQGEVTGIGAQVDQKAGVLTIVSPLPGSPAEKAGLLPGDEILAADDVKLTGLGFEEAVSKVRGPRGTQVKLHIRRNGNEMDITVTRDTIKIPEIEITWQNGIAVIKLMQFGETTDNNLRTMMKDVQKENPKGLILDLRNNPGGLLHAAGVVISNFIPKGTIYAKIHGKEEITTEKTEDDPTINTAVPLMVLVNKGSASASEITAGALQDLGRATVIGEQTYGKGTVQQVWRFNDGSSFKMTVAEWKTPDGRKIDGVGIKPDIETDQTKGARDETLLKALELLR